jgi:DHA2 family multidrug resistance protein
MEPHETQQGAGLISLTRQLGGSFGIAVLGTHLAGSIKTHQNQLADQLTYGSAALGERLQGATGLLVGAGNSPADAQKAAPAIVQMLVDREAAMMAFNNGFQLILVAFLLAAPMVMLLRKPRLGGGPGGPKGH